MSLSTEMLEYLDTLAKAIIGKAEHRLIRRIVTTFTDSDEEVPSSKLVKNEITTIRSEIPTKTSDLTNDSGFLTQHQDISGKEDKSNKVTSLSSNSTNDEYPSAKAVYDDVINKYNNLSDGLNNTYTTLSNGINSGLNSLSNTLFNEIEGRTDAIWETLNPLPNEIDKKEDKSNKVTTLSSESTDDEYPSAKAVYNQYNTLANGLTNVSNNIWDTLGPLTSHSHGNIVNDGRILIDGTSTSNKNVVTDSNGLIITEAKPTIPTTTSQLTNDSGFLTQHQDISGKEDVSNKVTSIDSNSTNTQYPSAKAVYDAIPFETITLTATLEDGTTKTYIVYGEEKIININSSSPGDDELEGAEIEIDPIDP